MQSLSHRAGHDHGLVHAMIAYMLGLLVFQSRHLTVSWIVRGPVEPGVQDVPDQLEIILFIRCECLVTRD
jgi:hypothetical protein